MDHTRLLGTYSCGDKWALRQGRKGWYFCDIFVKPFPLWLIRWMHQSEEMEKDLSMSILVSWLQWEFQFHSHCSCSRLPATQTAAHAAPRSLCALYLMIYMMLGKNTTIHCLKHLFCSESKCHTYNSCFVFTGSEGWAVSPAIEGNVIWLWSNHGNVEKEVTPVQVEGRSLCAGLFCYCWISQVEGKPWWWACL